MKRKVLIKEIKGVFKLPKKKYYIGKLKFGTPYFWPSNFCTSIIKVKKLISKTQDIQYEGDVAKQKYVNMPSFNRNKHWITSLFNDYYIEIGSPIKFHVTDLGWKDKFETPRFEWTPSFKIFFFNWQFCIFWDSPIESKTDSYFEQILWYLNYCKKDINLAKSSWPWRDGKSKESTWKDDFLV